MDSGDLKVVISKSHLVTAAPVITSSTVATLGSAVASLGAATAATSYTVFTVELVSGKEGKKMKEVEKRYRDFLALHRALRAKFPEVDGLHFPRKKTPFSTFAKSTVDDRRAFFQGYLNALLRLKPRPVDVTIFLGLDSGASSGTSATDSPSIEAKKKFGAALDDFDLLCVLGRGAFGKVFLVRERHLDQLFAMKVLTKKVIIEKKQVEHTLTERELMGTIHHPFIVELRFSFQNSRNLFMVSDFCAGGELFFHLRRLRGFSEDQIRFYTAEVILALEHLHSLNIVYRDLKPENLLLDEAGHIKLTDFGLAKQDVTLRDGATTYCGTPEYLSPEMIKIKGVSSAEYGFGVDFWSVGNLMYEMYTGRPPFQDKNPKIMIENILTQKVMFPEKKPGTIAFRDIINGFLEREPAFRLGCKKEGVSEIRKHAFFFDIDWIKLAKREITPPIKPDLKDSITRNFDKCFTDLDPNISVSSAPADEENFDGPNTALGATAAHSHHSSKNQKGMVSKLIGGVVTRSLNHHDHIRDGASDEELLNTLFKDFAFNADDEGKKDGANAAKDSLDEIHFRESEFESLWERYDDDLNAV